MNDAQNRIALKLCLGNDTQGVKIINLIKALVLFKHLAIDAVDVFDTAF